MHWYFLGWMTFLTGGLFVVAHHFLPRSQGLCDVVTGFTPSGRELWLTIDGGPDPVDTPYSTCWMHTEPKQRFS